MQADFKAKQRLGLSQMQPPLKKWKIQGENLGGTRTKWRKKINGNGRKCSCADYSSLSFGFPPLGDFPTTSTSSVSNISVAPPVIFKQHAYILTQNNPLFLSTAYQAYEDVQDMMDLPWLKHKRLSNHPQDALEWLRIEQFLICLPRELKHMHSFLC